MTIQEIESAIGEIERAIEGNRAAILQHEPRILAVRGAIADAQKQLATLDIAAAGLERAAGAERWKNPIGTGANINERCSPPRPAECGPAQEICVVNRE